MKYASLLLLGLSLPSLAIAQDQAAPTSASTNISASVQAKAVSRGSVVEIELASAEGWTCSGEMRSNSQASGGSSKGSGGGGGGSRSGGRSVALTPLRLTCTQGVAGSATVRTGAFENELTINFRLGDHGRGSVTTTMN